MSDTEDKKYDIKDVRRFTLVMWTMGFLAGLAVGVLL